MKILNIGRATELSKVLCIGVQEKADALVGVAEQFDAPYDRGRT